MDVQKEIDEIARQLDSRRNEILRKIKDLKDEERKIRKALVAIGGDYHKRGTKKIQEWVLDSVMQLSRSGNVTCEDVMNFLLEKPAFKNDPRINIPRMRLELGKLNSTGKIKRISYGYYRYCENDIQ